MQEVWKDIPEFCGIYQASNLGRIRRIDGKYGSTIRKQKYYRLKGEKTKSGYLRYTLCDKNGERKRFQGHRLVLSTFSGLNGIYVNHKNGNKLDNSLLNLEWCTQKYNVWHYRNVLGKKPEEKTSKKIVCIETGIIFISIHDAGKKLNIEATNICKALKGKTKTCGGYHWEYYNE